MARRPRDTSWDKVIGRRVFTLREERGLSMAELGALCLPPANGSQINKIEKGVTQVTMLWARRLADALGIHPLDILEPTSKLTPPEQKLLMLYRGLEEDQQETIFKVADAMAQSTGLKKTS